MGRSKSKSKSKTKSRSKLTKRAQNALEIAEKEIGGYESQGEDGQSRRRPVVNLLRRAEGHDSDDSERDEDDFEDEELDSDEALGSEDEYDVMNSRFSQTLRDAEKKSKDHGIMSESEDEGGYTSIDEDDLMPLSQVWDTNNKADEDSDEASSLKLENIDDNSEATSSSEDSSDGEEEEEEEEEEEDPFDEISQDEEDVELKTITSDLLKEATKKSVKKLDNYGGGKDSEYNLPSIVSSNTGRKLNLADMLSVVEDKDAVAKSTLIKGKNEAVSVPLPQRIQERHDRKAAYEISKQEVNKWKDVVAQNRRAEHLSFPINAPAEHNHASTFTRFSEAPQTELQEKVDSVLKESNLVEDQRNSKFEDLATAQMSPEMMKKRTAEVRLMRELMFREERKSKRIKKIKSKAYHRIKKKEMLKNKELAGVSDDEDIDEARAKERMTLKHKTNSRWAKDMIKHGMSNDAETREDIEEMLRQGERLKEKILDRGSKEEDDASLSDIERAYEKEDGAVVATKKIGKSGIMDMEFMKKAEARACDSNKRSIENLKAFENGDVDSLLSDNEQEDERTGGTTLLNQGRRIYTPAVSEEQSLLNREISELKVDQNKGKVNVEAVTVRENSKSPKSSESSEKITNKDSEDFNPWLNVSEDEDENKGPRSSKVSVIDKESSRMAKQANKIAKHGDKQSRRTKNSGSNDEDLLLDLEETNRLNIVDPYGGSDDEKGGFMFKQQESIAEAFAGDDVVADFDDEKRQIEIEEDDHEEDVTLPGWGDWAGAGSNPKKKRKFIKKVKGVMEKDKRKDKKLKNVIINERVNKKNLKYQSSAVPFPYENKEQYERSLRMPLGPEWTSRSSHQKLIKPKNLIKPSHVIDPLKAPFK